MVVAQYASTAAEVTLQWPRTAFGVLLFSASDDKTDEASASVQLCAFVWHLRRMADNDLPPVLTVDELAVLLRLNRKTVYEAINNGEIPGVRKIGKAIRISRDAVLTWLAEGQTRVPRAQRRRDRPT